MTSSSQPKALRVAHRSQVGEETTRFLSFMGTQPTQSWPTRSGMRSRTSSPSKLLGKVPGKSRLHRRVHPRQGHTADAGVDFSDEAVRMNGRADELRGVVRHLPLTSFRPRRASTSAGCDVRRRWGGCERYGQRCHRGCEAARSRQELEMMY